MITRDFLVGGLLSLALASGCKDDKAGAPLSAREQTLADALAGDPAPSTQAVMAALDEGLTDTELRYLAKLDFSAISAETMLADPAMRKAYIYAGTAQVPADAKEDEENDEGGGGNPYDALCAKLQAAYDKATARLPAAARNSSGGGVRGRDADPKEGDEPLTCEALSPDGEDACVAGVVEFLTAETEGEFAESEDTEDTEYWEDWEEFDEDEAVDTSLLGEACEDCKAAQDAWADEHEYEEAVEEEEQDTDDTDETGEGGSEPGPLDVASTFTFEGQTVYEGRDANAESSDRITESFSETLELTEVTGEAACLEPGCAWSVAARGQFEVVYIQDSQCINFSNCDPADDFSMSSNQGGEVVVTISYFSADSGEERFVFTLEELEGYYKTGVDSDGSVLDYGGDTSYFSSLIVESWEESLWGFGGIWEIADVETGEDSAYWALQYAVEPGVPSYLDALFEDKDTGPYGYTQTGEYTISGDLAATW